MKSQVAVYETHKKALDAIKVLNDSGFPMAHVSLLGKADMADEHIQIKSLEAVKDAPAFLGAGAGAVVGLLTGIGVFAIPGFGFLYGAGAVLGALAGFDLGIVSGGVLTLLATLGIKKDNVVKCHEHLNEGKYLVVIKGSLLEVEKAEQLLHTEGTHLEFAN